MKRKLISSDFSQFTRPKFPSLVMLYFIAILQLFVCHSYISQVSLGAHYNSIEQNRYISFAVIDSSKQLRVVELVFLDSIKETADSAAFDYYSINLYLDINKMKKTAKLYKFIDRRLHRITILRVRKLRRFCVYDGVPPQQNSHFHFVKWFDSGLRMIVTNRNKTNLGYFFSGAPWTYISSLRILNLYKKSSVELEEILRNNPYLESPGKGYVWFEIPKD